MYVSQTYVSNHQLLLFPKRRSDTCILSSIRSFATKGALTIHFSGTMSDLEFIVCITVPALHSTRARGAQGGATPIGMPGVPSCRLRLHLISIHSWFRLPRCSVFLLLLRIQYRITVQIILTSGRSRSTLLFKSSSPLYSQRISLCRLFPPADSPTLETRPRDRFSQTLLHKTNTEMCESGAHSVTTSSIPPFDGGHIRDETDECVFDLLPRTPQNLRN